MKRAFHIARKTVFIFIIGSGGALLAIYYLLPMLSNYPFFSEMNFLDKFKENVTIINKTEQVIVKEDDSVNKIASQANSTIVDIVSVKKPEKKILSSKLNTEEGKVGTGVIITSDGMIVAYSTSITKEDSDYKIILSSGETHEANLVGIDEFTNLAYLKIDGTNLSSISFSNSDDSFAGKKLIALATSTGEYHYRYGEGILSNINQTLNISGQSVSSSEKLEGVYESDFVNREEYAGSPVINYNGELVGIVGFNEVDGENQYFQIPSNVIQSSMDLAIRNELESRPFLGISYISITRPYALTNNLNRDKGALIYSASGRQGLAIIANSPAEKAGLKINDIITAVNEQEINLDNPLSNVINRHKKGEEIELSILREGEEIKLKINL